MSKAKLVKQLAKLLYNLDNLYYDTKDPEEKKEIKTQFNKISKQLEEAIRSQFDENDELYIEAVKQIKTTGKIIALLQQELTNLTKVFSLLSQITKELDALLLKSNHT